VSEAIGTLVPGWLAAAREPRVVAELELIFAEASRAIAARGPACWASGRCCNFDAAGHRLYATGLETAYCLLRAGVPSQGDLAAAIARGGCPYQVLNLCGAHGHKPIGCRVYFCDRSAQAWQQELYERLLAELRGLHERHAVSYVYSEWRGLLSAFVEGPSLADVPRFVVPNGGDRGGATPLTVRGQ